MKWMRDTEGSRMMSSMVNTALVLTRPLIIRRCFDGSTFVPALVVTLEVQAATA